jgi:predicted tellurium resistance membrane protein TerC
VLDLVTSPASWVSLATLSAMEIVLGIDNIVFLSILAGRLPPERQPAARRLGLAFALATRLHPSRGMDLEGLHARRSSMIRRATSSS